ncbi:MAG: hypothetical protein HKN70_04385 [Gammaproteobacteria bacterium]|nr:hypothetical protein [Gammaproteobacteria bacterium]
MSARTQAWLLRLYHLTELNPFDYPCWPFRSQLDKVLAGVVRQHYPPENIAFDEL